MNVLSMEQNYSTAYLMTLRSLMEKALAEVISLICESSICIFQYVRQCLTYWVGALKDQVLIEYAMQGISNQLFVSRYQLYLPDKQQLQDELQKNHRQ